MWGQLAPEMPVLDPVQPPLAVEGLKVLVEGSAVFRRCFSGFTLYDPLEQETIYENDADKCYIPASNTKILTFWTAWNVLGDSLPALRYVIKGDSLIFWGTGNPTFLHPDLPIDSSVLMFLKNRPERLYFSTHNFEDERYAPGWSWDNYNYDFQPERSPFPIYGNVAIFRRDRVKAGFEVSPQYFAEKTAYNSRLKSSYPYIRRRIDSNVFEYNARAMSGVPFKRKVPFRSSAQLVVDLLSDTLGRPVQLVDAQGVRAKNVYTLSIPLPDTVYKKLMQDSDNFIAEHLLMACSEKLFGTINAKQAILYANEHIFKGLVNDCMWEDGSGLSRYNLFTPRSVTQVLNRLYQHIPSERLLSLFATGGVNGTIKSWYGGKEKPYVYAKTGSLNGVHCLSGYVLTKTNRVMIFSFMHNNFQFGSDALKVDMEKVLRYVAEHY
jgi:D-alanyl-D-alanine carboxypeptidase/D-alanyl-D-alanine-endopeptidase (penicillin-binding protein 4)